MEQQKNYDIPDICDETVKKQNKPEKAEELTEAPKPEISLPDEQPDGAEPVPPVTPTAPDIPPQAPVVADRKSVV